MYPHERSLVEKMKDRPFALVGVNSDGDEKMAEAIKREKISWRSFSDGSGGPIAEAWAIEGWPTIVLIDHEGKIVSKGHSLNDAELEKLVAAAEAAQKK